MFFFQVAEIQAKSSEMEVKNSYLNSDLQKCERIRTEAAAESAKQLQLNQKTHDDQVDYVFLCVGRRWEPRETSIYLQLFTINVSCFLCCEDQGVKILSYFEFHLK